MEDVRGKSSLLHFSSRGSSLARARRFQKFGPIYLSANLKSAIHRTCSEKQGTHSLINGSFSSNSFGNFIVVIFARKMCNSIDLLYNVNVTNNYCETAICTDIDWTKRPISRPSLQQTKQPFIKTLSLQKVALHFFAWVDFLGLQMTWIMYEFA